MDLNELNEEMEEEEEGESRNLNHNTQFHTNNICDTSTKRVTNVKEDNLVAEKLSSQWSAS